MIRSIRGIAVAIMAGLSLAALPAHAQVQSVDPGYAIDGDLDGMATPAPPQSYPDDNGYDRPPGDPAYDEAQSAGNGMPVDTSSAPSGVDTWDAQNDIPAAPEPATGNAGAAPEGTYRQDDLIGAAQDVFGEGAQGLAAMIEDILKKQGRPNGYITGREASGALAIGVRYGSGTLHHKVEGNRPVYWTGPSLGFDLGLNTGKAFVLVYNLYDTQDLYERFPAGEGQAYVVGGFNVSYLRKGDIVLIPVRVGAGLRVGVNAGYMKFTEEKKWLPF